MGRGVNSRSLALVYAVVKRELFEVPVEISIQASSATGKFHSSGD